MQTGTCFSGNVHGQTMERGSGVYCTAAQFFFGSMTSETSLCWLSCVLAWLAALRRSGCRLGPSLASALSGWLAEDLEDVWRVSRRVYNLWFLAVVLTLKCTICYCPWQQVVTAHAPDAALWFALRVIFYERPWQALTEHAVAYARFESVDTHIYFSRPHVYFHASHYASRGHSILLGSTSICSNRSYPMDARAGPMLLQFLPAKLVPQGPSPPSESSEEILNSGVLGHVPTRRKTLLFTDGAASWPKAVKAQGRRNVQTRFARHFLKEFIREVPSLRGHSRLAGTMSIDSRWKSLKSYLESTWSAKKARRVNPMLRRGPGRIAVASSFDSVALGP